jgi:hypothetical protein
VPLDLGEEIQAPGRGRPETAKHEEQEKQEKEKKGRRERAEILEHVVTL